MACPAIVALYAVRESQAHHCRVPEPRHPKAARLIDHWCDAIVRHGLFVLGRHVPARAIVPILPHLVICEPSGGDLRIRLAGGAASRCFGEAGALLSDLFPDNFSDLLDTAYDALASGCPRIVDAGIKRRKTVEIHDEIVLLPIVDRDETTPLLLVGLFPFRR